MSGVIRKIPHRYPHRVETPGSDFSSAIPSAVWFNLKPKTTRNLQRNRNRQEMCPCCKIVCGQALHSVPLFARRTERLILVTLLLA
jgi:hypothetical protein